MIAYSSKRAKVSRPQIRPAGPVARSGQPRPLFELGGVSHGYRQRGGERVVVFDRLELAIPAVTFVGIVGPSGHGKSTLLHLLGGLEPPHAGELSFRGRPMPRLATSLRRFRLHHVAFVWQELNLVGHLDARHNVALPRLAQRERRREALAVADMWLDRLGMGRLERRMPAQLSGGQKQRVAIARALASDAEVILADEPTGSLDPGHAHSVMGALREVAEEDGRHVLVVSHDVPLVAHHADVLLHLADGRVRQVEHGDRKNNRRRRRARQRVVALPVRHGLRPVPASLRPTVLQRVQGVIAHEVETT